MSQGRSPPQGLAGVFDMIGVHNLCYILLLSLPKLMWPSVSHLEQTILNCCGGGSWCLRHFHIYYHYPHLRNMHDRTDMLCSLRHQTGAIWLVRTTLTFLRPFARSFLVGKMVIPFHHSPEKSMKSWLFFSHFNGLESCNKKGQYINYIPFYPNKTNGAVFAKSFKKHKKGRKGLPECAPHHTSNIAPLHALKRRTKQVNMLKVHADSYLHQELP